MPASSCRRRFQTANKILLIDFLRPPTPPLPPGGGIVAGPEVLMAVGSPSPDMSAVGSLTPTRQVLSCPAPCLFSCPSRGRSSNPPCLTFLSPFHVLPLLSPLFYSPLLPERGGWHSHPEFGFRALLMAPPCFENLLLPTRKDTG